MVQLSVAVLTIISLIYQYCELLAWSQKKVISRRFNRYKAKLGNQGMFDMFCKHLRFCLCEWNMQYNIFKGVGSWDHGGPFPWYVLLVVWGVRAEQVGHEGDKVSLQAHLITLTTTSRGLRWGWWAQSPNIDRWKQADGCSCVVMLCVG